MILKSLFGRVLLTLLLVSALPAVAAKFVVQDVSGQQQCLPAAFLQMLKSGGGDPAPCWSYPAGTVQVTITPAPGELPVQCDGARSGALCAYAANFYIAAYYQGSWRVKSPYAWTPIDLSQITPVTQWPIFDGRFSDIIYVADLDLNTSRFDPPPSDIDVYVALATMGVTNFAPNLVVQVYPVPKQ